MYQKDGKQRHDEKLRDDAQEYLEGTAQDFREIARAQGQPHAEHDDAERIGNRWLERREDLRRSESGDGKDDCPQGECLTDEGGKLA